MEIVKKYNAEGIHERNERLEEILKNGFLKFILGLNHAIEKRGLKVDRKDERKLMWAAGLIIYMIREVIESNKEDPSWVFELWKIEW